MASDEFPGEQWQPTFDDLGKDLIETTFVIVDLETTGGSPKDSEITEIGAVKVRGGEILGEFQSFVDPGMPIPPFITVLTGITDAMVIGAPKIGEALFSFLEFLGSPDETVLVAHNAPFDIGFLKFAAAKLDVQWPNFQVIDTARIARYALNRDEVPNFKLASLATFFGARTTPEHRALADARATTDVLHGVFERLGSMGVRTIEDLRTFTNRVTDAQRRKRHFAEGLPARPGVYIFKDDKGAPLYIGTTRNLRTRVRTYFTAAETRKRIHDMVALADRVEIIETPTIIEAEIRELRMIAKQQPRFNRRSRFQEKAIWVKLTQENFPRLTQVRGAAGITDSDGWCGPFNGRDEATRAIEAIHEIFPIRQCTPRITVSSMKKASPCALLGIGKCGAPCVGAQSLDSYDSIVTEIKHSLHEDLIAVSARIQERMQSLALSERFEEAADLRDRLAALVRGSARGQRIRALTRVPELAVARANESKWELVLIRYGRLAGSMATSSDRIVDSLSALIESGEVVAPEENILPASSHEEVEVLLRFINHPETRLLHINGGWTSPIRGAGRVRADLEQVRNIGTALRYKEDFANSFDKPIQR